MQFSNNIVQRINLYCNITHMMHPVSKLTISSEEYAKIVSVERTTQDKRTSQKLKVLMLRYEGYDSQTINERLGISSTRVTHLIGEYFKKGLDEYIRKKHGGNHCNMSVKEEKEILEVFKAKAAAGQIVTTAEIKKAFDKKLGRDTGHGYIYMLLAQHEWRKAMPRTRHLKKIDDETIEALKKLTKL